MGHFPDIFREKHPKEHPKEKQQEIKIYVRGSPGTYLD
jgi:hypothetical protein